MCAPCARKRTLSLRGEILAQRSDNSPKTPQFEVTGTIPDIRPYLGGASVAAMPLKMARGIQNKILEAMAMGIPVATTTTVAAALPDKLEVESDGGR